MLDIQYIIFYTHIFRQKQKERPTTDERKFMVTAIL